MTEPPVERFKEYTELLRKVGQNWADVQFWFEKFVASHELLLSRFAPFKIGDRVQLAVTPVITADATPGWLGSKHFLIAGARGVVKGVDVMSGRFYFQIAFDSETWIDMYGKEQPVTDRHVYTFSEAELEKVAPEPDIADPSAPDDYWLTYE